MKRLILVLATFGVVFTSLNTLITSYHVHRSAFIKDTLHSNQVYASKLAQVTELFLQSVNSQLHVSAYHISTRFNDLAEVQKELERLISQTNSFDSLVVVDTQGQIIAVKPDLDVLGKSISKSQLEAVKNHQPKVLDPFVSPAGNLMISPTYPIVSENGEYMGFVAGGIYLQGNTILNRLLGRHHYEDGSYLYVVDGQARLLYHIDTDRVGDVVSGNKVIAQVLQGETGASELINSAGVSMIAGFAPIPMTGWGVVSQRPMSSILDELGTTHRSVIYSSIPATIFILGLILIAGIQIAKPLTRLAKQLATFDHEHADTNGVRAWYYEAANLKRTLVRSNRSIQKVIKSLDNDRKTDKLTSLHNRFSLEFWLKNAIHSNLSMSVLAIDIDHFKCINDLHGHMTGDKVLKEIANVMRHNARSDDFICRAGGEEFLAFMPKLTLHEALDAAERLRKKVAAHTMPEGIKVTVSIGVSDWSSGNASIEQAIALADKALYRAKHTGRNKSCHIASV
ncbi:sensor domain-containing diguanylate cyclase [Pseudoalteromonas sp. SMS1]|uniref:sensor domain-containing diguanylate cyclase n=1 Tax=Pseudoalteromonas sp. SMS1 TaxID=2908894 RepID=UPI001F46B80C|nr:sensor domain-containing diguanylate cyclase [Pseudoalteromonas sp. SMS1]MCF2858746.1 sensor domain-containing diguanylate cyclase [Pseudoalteromonas sp. SMS1]